MSVDTGYRVIWFGLGMIGVGAVFLLDGVARVFVPAVADRVAWLGTRLGFLVTCAGCLVVIYVRYA